MISLHHVMQELKAGKISTRSTVHENDVDQAEYYLAAYKDRVQCFDLGDAFGLADFKAIPELVRLPYECCWFEFDGGKKDGIRYAIFAFELSSISFFALCFCAMPAEPMSFIGSMCIAQVQDEREISLGFPEYGSPLKSQIGTVISSVIARFLSALHCKNVTRIEHKPDPAHQKRRAKQGRAPLFSYWTLHLDMTPGSRERADHGGTHASPRLHLRRGHPRQFKPGEWTWVQPAVVGSKHGIVHKDYAVKGPR